MKIIKILIIPLLSIMTLTNAARWKETLYSSSHHHSTTASNCYGGDWGGHAQTAFFLNGGKTGDIKKFYFCDNSYPYWWGDKWAPQKNSAFHNDILSIDWKARNIRSVEIGINYEKWLRSNTFIIDYYVINYANGAGETKNSKDGGKTDL